MHYVAHRGNIAGSNLTLENNPKYIMCALNLGLMVEIDVWWLSSNLHMKAGFYLGHDEPQYYVDSKFLMDEKMLCHAKNMEALEAMMNTGGIHCFWHNTDSYTITNQGVVIAYPGESIPAMRHSLCMMPEIAVNNDTQDFITYIKGLHRCGYICTDFPLFAKSIKEGINGHG